MFSRKDARRWAIASTVSLLVGCGSESLDQTQELFRSDTQEIVGGTNMTIEANPRQVSLQSSSGSHFHGGSVISAGMILMLEQKEADRPPPAPNLTGNVTIAGEEPSTMAYEGNEGSLWTISGSTRRVLSLSVPGSSTAFLAFGLVYVDETEYLWRVNFVAHIEDSSALSDFLSEMPSGTTLQTSPPTAVPEEWADYMEDPFAS